MMGFADVQVYAVPHDASRGHQYMGCYFDDINRDFDTRLNDVQNIEGCKS